MKRSNGSLKYTAGKLSALVASLIMVLAFQNCSQGNFGENLQHVNSNSTSSANGSAGAGSNAGGVNNLSQFSVKDSSIGNGVIITQLKQVIQGGGAGLRGCTGQISKSNTTCLSDSEFIYITDARAWGPNAYNATTDTYSVDANVVSIGFPFEMYYTRYILADGRRIETTFTPTMVAQSLPGSGVATLKWVYTNPQTCFGPTPAPAPIGQACSVQGQTATNACGTATCMYQ